MKALVISKPIYDYILPLVEFPQDGDNFYINDSIETISSVGTLTAITLAQYGVDVSYTGMIGEDDIGNKVKSKLENYNIDTQYIETSYTEKTCSSYKIYNQKTNKFTSIIKQSLKTNLTKFKYDFTPDAIIMDDGDYVANLAAINNFPNSKLIYIGEKFTNDSKIYCNKCTYIIASLSFASDSTGVINDLSKPKNIVQLFQKFIDQYNANLIIRLNNFDILYCINDEVRIIKNINKNIINKENLYNSILCYFLINTNDIENSIKLTNKVMLESKNDIDMVKNIPEYQYVKSIIDNISKKENETVNITPNTEINEQTTNIKTNETGDNEIEKL